MKRTLETLLLGLVLVLATSTLPAQESASFRLNEHVFNAGGRPEGGTTATSAGFAVTFDAIGDGVFPAALTAASFNLGGGFVTAYPPPGEVTGLLFTAADTLVWNPEPSVGEYNLYRGTLDTLAALTFGGCAQQSIAATTTNDGDAVAPGQGYHYLVTAENLLAEEGTKGHSSSGAERANPAPCP